MEVLISATGQESVSDLTALRDWLESAGDGVPWKLAPEPPPGADAPGADALGVGVDEICAIITVITNLPPLVDRIRDWFGTRQDPGPIRVTININPADSGTPADPAKPAESGDAGQL
jgi:hypothetical protein